MSATALRLTSATLVLLCTVAGCRSSGTAYRSAGGGVAAAAAPVADRFAVRIVVQGLSQVQWVEATRVEEVLNRAPGLVAIPKGTDDLTLRIRGVEAPAVMIDGVPALAGDLLLLYPWEIAQVEVLRDVASTAVYGAMGAGGVVKVTTRRARHLEP